MSTPDANLDAAVDGATAPDAATDGGVAHDAAPDGSPVDGGGCHETIDAFCATDASCMFDCPCVEDWATASHNASQRCAGGPSFANRVYVYPQCDGFNLIVVGYTDTSVFYYYDPGTSALVRVEEHGNANGAYCVAGQPGPTVPLTDCFADGATPVSICTADAGTDAATDQ